MVVSKQISHLENSAVQLVLSVGRDDVRAQYDELLANYTKSIQLPGFRKGKVPREVIERKFGPSLKGEAMGHIMEKALQTVFEEEDFPTDARPLPYSTPSVKEEPALDFDKDLSFSVTYDVFPPVKVEQWKALEVEAPVCQVSDEDIDRELEEIRERNAIVLDKEEGLPAAKGDVVTLSYAELDENGGVVPGSQRQDFVFTLGTGANIYKIDDDVEGMKKDETKDIVKTYPADFEDATLAGTTKKLRITVQAVKEKKLPALDDDLAQDVNEKYHSLADLKADLKSNMEKTVEHRIRELTVQALLEKILEATPIVLPESMVQVEQDSRWRNMARQFNSTSEQMLKVLEGSGKTYEALMEEWRPDVERALKSRLIVETLIKDQGINATEEEVENEMASMAAGMGVPVEEVKKHYEKENMKEYLRDDIREKKLYDLLIRESKIKKGKKIKYLDLLGKN